MYILNLVLIHKTGGSALFTYTPLSVASILNGYTMHSAVISGVFIARGKEDTIVTKNMVVGESVYGEKRISTEVCLVSVCSNEGVY